MKQESNRYKVILLGDGGTGKTSLKRTYLGLDYVDNYAMTLGVSYSVKMFQKNIIQIWDIGGQRVYENMVEEYFKGTHGAVIVFDVTNRKSFENIERWVELLSTRIGQMVPSVLVGNKSDLRYQVVNEVSPEEAQNLSHKLSYKSLYEIPYFETSAKTGLNVDHLFNYLIGTLNSIYSTPEFAT